MAKSQNKKAYSILILTPILVITTIFSSYQDLKTEKSALKERLDYYNEVVRNEQKWLSGVQLLNGALAFRGEENGTASVIPYFSCITSIALMQKAPNLQYEDIVLKYFDWHFAHLNQVDSDINRVPGTIYNYDAQVLNGIVQWEKTKQEYDSTDSYAALFLIALWEYYEQTGNTDYFLAHFRQINDIIGAMIATIDKDGLSYAKPDNQVKYLMDNSEVFKGLSCAINLLERVFLPNYGNGTEEYSSIKQSIAQLMEIKKRQEQAFGSVLWNETDQRYEIGMNKDGSALRFTGWTKFYPDAVVQLSPIIFGVLDPKSEQAINLYQTFGKNFAWEKMDHYDQGDTDFYWGLTAYCAALMGDEEKVDSYLAQYMVKVVPDYKYPAYNADVAWVVLASAEMARFYQLQMDKIDPLGIVRIP